MLIKVNVVDFDTEDKTLNFRKIKDVKYERRHIRTHSLLLIWRWTIKRIEYQEVTFFFLVVEKKTKRTPREQSQGYSLSIDLY